MFQSGAMGSKRLDSVSDLARHGYDLRVACCRCDRVGILDAQALTMDCVRSGRSRRLDKIVDRLKCRACGDRNVEWRPIERE